MDHPASVERLAVLDISPTRVMYAETDKAFATAGGDGGTPGDPFFKAVIGILQRQLSLFQLTVELQLRIIQREEI